MEKFDFKQWLNMPLLDLVSQANMARNQALGDKLDLCHILNAKAGLCQEDCKFCAQSARHKTGAPVYPLKSKKEIMEAAAYAKEIGAERFGIVTSGNRLSSQDVDLIAEVLKEIRVKINIKICASLGALRENSLKKLKNAGLGRYHHNIETSPGFYSQIVTTHNFQERINTIKAAKLAGLEVCSGGIIGLGESWQDRIEMALTLRELEVDSVPLNILVPIPGTPMASQPVLSAHDAIRTIAIFRLILPGKTIKIAAGRESVLKDFQALAFLAGANGMLIGGYLTIKGREVKEDHKLVDEIKKMWETPFFKPAA